MSNHASPINLAIDQHPRKIRRSQSQWQAIFKEFTLSGLGSQAFCRKHGIAKSSFYKWRSKLSDETPETQADSASSAANQFIEIAPATLANETPAQDWAVELAIGKDFILRIRQPV